MGVAAPTAVPFLTSPHTQHHPGPSAVEVVVGEGGGGGLVMACPRWCCRRRWWRGRHVALVATVTGVLLLLYVLTSTSPLSPHHHHHHLHYEAPPQGAFRDYTFRKWNIIPGHGPDCPDQMHTGSLPPDLMGNDVYQLYVRLDRVDASVGRLDSSRQYQTQSFLVAGREWRRVNTKWLVCLGTQTSVDKLFWVMHQAETWTGPLSVAVYAPGYDYSVFVIMMVLLQQCQARAWQTMAFHLTYPTDLPPVLVDNAWQLASNLSCRDDAEDVNMKLVERLRPDFLTSYLNASLYPQNILRNEARSGCATNYSYIPDIDMILVKNMASQLNTFLATSYSRKCDKCAYIIPTYEIHNNVTHNPENKQQLLQLLEDKLAQRFHEKVWAPNQGNSLLHTWEKLNQTSKLEVGYIIPNWTLYWEPLYVINGAIPPFDERFEGYGFTRSSQVMEMHLRGFKWHMLNNAFTCHRGFSDKKPKSAFRVNQTNLNEERFKIFELQKLIQFNLTYQNYMMKVHNKWQGRNKTKTTKKNSHNATVATKKNSHNATVATKKLSPNATKKILPT